MFNKARIFLTDRCTFVLWLAGLLYTVPVYNKYWAPFDEGIIAVAAQMLLAGEIPYKDFFIVMYPPGQIYVLAAIFKIFSYSLMAARLYTVFVSVAGAMLVFFMTRLLTKNSAVSIFAWLMALTSLAPRLGAIPAPIWPGMLLGVLSIYIYMLYLKNGRLSYVILTGIACGAAIAFRHDIGIFASAAILLPLSMESSYKKFFKRIAFFIAPILLITSLWVAYFISKSASKDIFNSLVAFTSIHQKTAALPFPRPCLDLRMIFHGSLQFININQFYIPILAYIFISAFLLFKGFGRSRYDEMTKLSLTAILLFGVFTFNQARIRTDPAHLLTVIHPTMVLCAFILYDTFSQKFNTRPSYLTKCLIAGLIAALLPLLLVKNVDKYLKNTYTKVYKKSIIRTAFDRGPIYVPKDEREDVLSTIKFIKDNTLRDDRIYIGNMAHWKDDFGGSTIIYFLADRLPAVKFYELLPGLVTDKSTQQEIRDSLKEKEVKLIVLQDVDTGEMKREDVPGDARILDDFIQANYAPAAKFGKYNLFNRISR